jgi:TRAP transporter TAXI family solute receptor
MSEEIKRLGSRFGSPAWLGMAVMSLLCFLLLAGPQLAWAQKTIRISIATGGTGGVWYPYGGVMANIISKYLPDVEATAEVTAASVDNALLLGAGKVDLAFMFGDVGYEAYAGKGRFKEKVPMRCLASLYPSVTHIVCLDGTGITSVKDLKGKRISTGAPGSATEVVACRVLEAYGLDPEKDVSRDRLSAAESAGALKDRKIDAYFWTGGVPTSSVVDLAATPGLKIRLIDHADAVDKLIKKYGPIYYKSVCPANTYPRVDYDVTTVTAGNFLTCLEKTDAKLAYGIVKVLFDHRDELIAGHKVAQNLKLETAVLGAPYPLHKGAAQFYKEKGVKLP